MVDADQFYHVVEVIEDVIERGVRHGAMLRFPLGSEHLQCLFARLVTVLFHESRGRRPTF
jgi:hypothetical protein